MTSSKKKNKVKEKIKQISAYDSVIISTIFWINIVVAKRQKQNVIIDSF